MATQPNTDFTINQDGYAAFDAVSLKNLIKERLNAGGKFTDQQYEGSNISSIIDIIAYSYHVLLFYLNRTASESLFSQATIYENINKIVQEINYKPIGFQTALLPFKAFGSNQLIPGTYTIPRYAFFTVNGINYSFTSDVSFNKNSTDAQELTDLEENAILHQGVYIEYAPYEANGDNFEEIIVTYNSDNQDQVIDHFGIDVYVKEQFSGKYYQYTETSSLFLEGSNARKFEKRFNENQRYEIKFGNGINGRKLEKGDIVQVYFLKSDGGQGQIDSRVLDGNPLFLYKSSVYDIIYEQTKPAQSNTISPIDLKKLSFINIDSSTKFTDKESVENIKINAPKLFSAQNRLVTTTDYESFVNKNFNNFISSTKAVNNWDYINGHLKYFYNMGFGNPNSDPRTLFSQVKFSDACDFNNVYIYGVPRLEKITSLTQRTNFLNTSQKELILNEVQPLKMATAEVIINDPVYVAVDFGVRKSGETPNFSQTTNSKLIITKNILSRIDNQTIQDQTYNILKDFFSSTKNSLGILLDINSLTNKLFDIQGILNFYTERNDSGTILTSPGLNFLVWNPVYPDQDTTIVSQNYQLPYFKYPFLNNPLDLLNKIEVRTVDNNDTKAEY